MCSNYVPVTRSDRLLSFFGVHRDARTEPPIDVWPTGLAPFIRLRAPGGDGRPIERLVDDGHFGLLPPFATEVAAGRRTYNARSETVAIKPSFRDAWRRGQRCIIPAEGVYEPRYNAQGKAERWYIHQPGHVPMGLAGIWTQWRDALGNERLTFAMLTVNADGHPLYSQFHKPGEEKRMVVILAPGDYDAWLACPVAEAARFLKPWPGELEASARLLPPRGGA
ncbi:MAG: SOS response-associated peptidase [Ramlibacter sp.]